MVKKMFDEDNAFCSGHPEEEAQPCVRGVFKDARLCRFVFGCRSANERGELTRRGALLPGMQHRVVCCKP